MKKIERYLGVFGLFLIAISLTACNFDGFKKAQGNYSLAKGNPERCGERLSINVKDDGNSLVIRQFDDGRDIHTTRLTGDSLKAHSKTTVVVIGHVKARVTNWSKYEVSGSTLLYSTKRVVDAPHHYSSTGWKVQYSFEYHDGRVNLISYANSKMPNCRWK